jgi:hypothetical protein
MVRLSRGTLRQSRNGFAETNPETASMTPVGAREKSTANEEPLRWHLLTTIEFGDAAAACEIVRFYRLDQHGGSQESSGGRVRPATRHFGWNIAVLFSVPSKSARRIGKR